MSTPETGTESDVDQRTGPAAAAPQEVVREGRDGRPRRQDDFTAEVHVYEPHRVGMPPLRSYARAVWQRRQFALEMSRTELRAQHFNTVFGQLWLVLNPLLLAFVYFLLVDILRSGARGADFFAHLVAGLFLYQLMSGAVRPAAKSVVKGGRLILNTAFPRTLLPLSSVITSFMRFLPTFAIYIPVHIATGLPFGWHMLWIVPIVAMVLVFAAGLSMLVAALQVYFRDLANFLPYVLRIWLYASPILYYASEVPDKYQPVLDANPIAPLLIAWSDVLNRARPPSEDMLLLGLASALVLFAVGAIFFITREREFAVRL